MQLGKYKLTENVHILCIFSVSCRLNTKPEISLKVSPEKEVITCEKLICGYIIHQVHGLKEICGLIM